MKWNKTIKKINYLVLLTLTKTVNSIVGVFLKDADVFLRRYPLLTVEPNTAWHYFGLGLEEMFSYGLAKRPLFFKILTFLSLLISLSVICLGGLLNFNQAQTLQAQTERFNQILAVQTAYVLDTPLLLNNQAEIKTVVSHLMQEKTVSGIVIYDSNHSIVKTYGVHKSVIFPRQEIEYSAEPNNLEKIINNMLGKVQQITRYTTAIKHNGLMVGYLSLSFDYTDLDVIRLETLYAIIKATLIALMIAVIAAFYLSGLLFKPLDELSAMVEAMQQINAGENKHSPKNIYHRKDELEVFMESINGMNKGLVQKDKVESVFSRYVSAQVANQVLHDLDTIGGVKLGGEHLMASVFFADIVGFTSLSETLNPQEISELLNVYFSKIIKVVKFCNGRVDKFIGDCAMVVFGVPEKNPQHAFNCVACAWMILQLVKRLNDKREDEGLVTVEFRIGANSGMMLAGNMGSAERMEYTVVGDSVNLASRLSGSGEPGELVITEDVFVEHGLEGMVLTEVKDLIKLRGKKLPVKILSVKDILTPFKEEMLTEIPKIIASETSA
jgi:adenylate cyclase